jgi:hypothetical protein
LRSKTAAPPVRSVVIAKRREQTPGADTRAAKSVGKVFPRIAGDARRGCVHILTQSEFAVRIF